MTRGEAEGKVVHVLGPHAFDRYVGRAVPRKGLASDLLHNPFRIGKDGDRREVLVKFRDFANRCISAAIMADSLPGYTGNIENEMLCQGFRDEINSCARLVLACWCCEPRDAVLAKDDPIRCHAQIILKIAEDGIIPTIEEVS